tara:strand:- start:338 stop:535 length:198 start_codon:yes stop_codon:yes gene_type:complete
MSQLRIFDPQRPDYSPSNREKLAAHIVESMDRKDMEQVLYKMQLEYYEFDEEGFERDWENYFGEI